MAEKNPTAPAKHRKRRRKKKSLKQRLIAYGLRLVSLAVIILIILLIVIGVRGIRSGLRPKPKQAEGWPTYVVDGKLTVNSNSRPALRMGVVKEIVIHNSHDSGSSAKERRDYYESLKDLKGIHASSHLIVGSEGEAYLCIPVDEIAYMADDANTESISIEYCCEDPAKEPEDAEYQTLVKLTAWVCLSQNIPVTSVVRHYDINGRSCPEYYVQNEDKWSTFLEDVRKSSAEQMEELNNHEENRIE